MSHFLKKQYSPYQFAIVRITFGVYLTIFFARILPFAKELFSSEGMLSSTDRAVFLDGSFATHLYPLATPSAVTALCVLLVCSALLFTAGVHRRWQAFFLWVGWCLLANLNPFSVDPSLPFIGLLLLAFVVVPAGEPLSYSRTRSSKQWYMPAVLYWGLWLVWGLSFSVSGFEKYQSALWREGTAVHYFYTGVLSIDTIVSQTLDVFPLFIGVGITWLILYSQLLALPAVATATTRKLFWFCTFGLFFFSAFVIDLLPVVLGMLVFYLFLFDSTWFARNFNHAVVYIDSGCNQCSWFGSFLQTESFKKPLTVTSFLDPTLEKYLTQKEITAMREMVYVEDGVVYRGADAIIQSVSSLGGGWRLIIVLWIVPKKFRNSLYQFLSSHRR